MRIPLSSIVMGAVVAGLFTLAIRDTNHGRAEELDLTGAKARERELVERMRRQRDAREAEAEARRRTREAKLDSLVGGTPGTPGALFDGVHLGAPIDAFQSEEARERLYDAMSDHFVEVSYFGDRHLERIKVEIPPSICGPAYERIVAKWGASRDNTWVDHASRRHARFDYEKCVLIFDVVTEPEVQIGAPTWQ